jgi:pimeloyl-ACP methyl ester carboxylesterase/DNA-binding CsgD family transcriptional regulator
VIGSGPVLLFPPSIMSILEWVSDSPTGPDFFAALAAHRTVVAYDRHGCGLSDRDRTDFTLADDMQDLEAVVGTIDQQRFDIVATSSVAPAVAFASTHPERVRRLVLLEPSIAVRTERNKAMYRLIETGNRESWVQALTGLGFPSGTDEATFQSVVRFLRTAASLEVLLGLLRNSPDQIEPFLDSVQAPTLVLHRRDDAVSPLELHGKEFARRIPNARLVPLDGDQHIPWSGDWQSVASRVLEFLMEPDPPDGSNGPKAHASGYSTGLTPRELEVLALVAHGNSNLQIASELVISPYTVNRHVSNIYAKIEAPNRAAATAYALRHGIA